MTQKNNKDSRLDTALGILSSLKFSGLKSKELLAAPGDNLDKIIWGLQKLASEYSLLSATDQTNEGQLQSFIKAIRSMTSLDFSKNLSIESKGSVFDTLAKEINHLKEKMQTSTVSTTYFDNIINSMIDSLIVINSEGIIELVNKATTQLLGYQEKELIGNPIDKIIPFDALEENIFDFLLVPNDGKVVEMSYISSKGIHIPIFFSASQLFNANKEVTGIVCVAHNITSLKEAQKEKLKLVYLIENSDDFIAIASLEGKVEFVNKAGRKLVGLEPDQPLSNYNITEFLTKEAALNSKKNEIPAVLKNGSWSGESFLRHFISGESIPTTKNTFLIADEKTGKPIGIGTIQRDSTISKLQEKQILTSKTEYENLVQCAKVLIMKVGKDGNINFANKYAQDFFGFPLEELIGKHVTETIVPPIDSEGNDLKKMVTQAFTKPEEFGDSINENVCKNGEPKIISWANKPLYSKEGEFVEILTIGSDLTEQQSIARELEKYKNNLELLVEERTKTLEQLNEKLENNEKQYQFLAKNSSDAVLAYDAQLNSTYISPSIEKLTGYSIEELKQMSTGELVHPEDLDFLLNKFKEAIVNKSSSDLFRYRRKTKSGIYLWVESVGSYVYDTDGNLQDIIINLRDITQKKEAEEKLEASINFNQLLFKKSKIGLVLKDFGGRIIDANWSFADIIGYTLEEVIGMNTWDLIPEQYKEAETEKYKSLRKLGSYKPFEKEYLHKDGYLVPIRLQGTIITKNGEDLIWSSIENISERVAAEKNWRDAKDQLIISDKMASLGVLTAGIAHEINNPVNFVYAGINSLETNLKDVREILDAYAKIDGTNTQDKLAEIEELKKELQFDRLMQFVDRSTENIKKGAERTSEIIKGLKRFTRVDDDKLIKSDLHENLENALLLLKNQYKDKVTIEKQFGNIPLINCYPGKLNQVFVNLLSNAIQAIEANGKITVSTKLCNTKESDIIEINISDTGSGISEEHRKKIFEPFFTTKEIGKGTGLGLSISHGIIESHNGIIEVSSEVGKGTTFTIQLPIV